VYRSDSRLRPCPAKKSIDFIRDVMDRDWYKAFPTAYSGELRVHDSEAISGFVMSRAVKVGARLSKFELLDSGQSSSEKVNGKVNAFRKEPAGCTEGSLPGAREVMRFATAPEASVLTGRKTGAAYGLMRMGTVLGRFRFLFLIL
jgi:hypothetical protein